MRNRKEGRTSETMDNLLENERQALTYLFSGGWIDEQTLVRRFGENTITNLYEAGAIARHEKDDPLWKGFQYSITHGGKLLLKFSNDNE